MHVSFLAEYDPVPVQLQSFLFYASVWLIVRSLTLAHAWFWQHFHLLLDGSWVLSFKTSLNFPPLFLFSDLVNSFCKSFPSLDVQSLIIKYCRVSRLIIIFMTLLFLFGKIIFFFDSLSNQVQAISFTLVSLITIKYPGSKDIRGTSSNLCASWWR